MSRAASGAHSDFPGSSGGGSEWEGQQQGQQPQLKSKKKRPRRKGDSRPNTSAEGSSAVLNAEEVQGSSSSTHYPAAPDVPGVPATSIVESSDSCAVSIVAKSGGGSPGGDTVVSENAEEDICSGLSGIALSEE